MGFVGLPDSLKHLLTARAYSWVEDLKDWAEIANMGHDYLHLFTDRAATVDAALPKLPEKLHQNGMIWVSWPTKASKVETDLNEDLIRARAVKGVLVDVKVCAVDQTWSGLKLVIRKEYRK